MATRAVATKYSSFFTNISSFYLYPYTFSYTPARSELFFFSNLFFVRLSLCSNLSFRKFRISLYKELAPMGCLA
jgi:hypothetical protein